MYCVKCNKDVIYCTCPDIDARLKDLLKCPAVAPAAQLNIEARIEMQLKKEKENNKDVDQ